MRKLILLLIATWLIHAPSFSQNSITLNINHQLGSSNFALNTGAKNNLGDDFNLSRLEYYLSKFTIVHDGGMETNIDNIYALVDASAATAINLGSHNVTTVEAIKFHIGVDSATNHLDPASYPASHPLAPQLPSMHWGWASGYRFVALEGNGGSNYNQTIELHGLGNQNYYETEIVTAATAANGAIIVDIYADYARALENISVNGGAFVHGFDSDARRMILNFKDFVFGGFPSSVFTHDDVNTMDVFPNPTTGLVNVKLETASNQTYDLIITDALGRNIETINEIRSNQNISTNLNQAGLYFIQLVQNGKPVLTQKVIVHF